MKRASSLKLYAAWFDSTGRELNTFFSEPAIFAYVAHLHSSRAPASRAAALREAMNFMSGVFMINLDFVRASARIRGMACKSLRTRGVARQRRPLTKEMVITLETVLTGEHLSATNDAIIAGTALFAVFARARVGDLRRCDLDPTTDLTDDQTAGFVETRFMEHKCARPGSRHALPIAAPAFGLTPGSWGAQSGLRPESGHTYRLHHLPL